MTVSIEQNALIQMLDLQYLFACDILRLFLCFLQDMSENKVMVSFNRKHCGRPLLRKQDFAIGSPEFQVQIQLCLVIISIC